MHKETGYELVKSQVQKFPLYICLIDKKHRCQLFRLVWQFPNIATLFPTINSKAKPANKHKFTLKQGSFDIYMYRAGAICMVLATYRGRNIAIQVSRYVNNVAVKRRSPMILGCPMSPLFFVTERKGLPLHRKGYIFPMRHVKNTINIRKTFISFETKNQSCALHCRTIL